MNRKVKSILLTFENCDYVTIPIEYLGCFYMKDVRQITSLHKDIISWEYTANEVYICLDKRICKNILSLDCDIHVVKYGGEGFFERIIKYDSITYLTINYSDNTKYVVYLAWEDEENCEHRNKCQKTAVDEYGDLVIEIEKK